MHHGYGVHHAGGGGAALGLWLAFGRNGLLVVLGQDGVDVVGIGRQVRLRLRVGARVGVEVGLFHPHNRDSLCHGGQG